jgi:hypothetical protein
MRKPADCVADTFLNLDFAPGSPFHFFDNVRRNFQPFKHLLGNGVIDGLQILAGFLCAWHSKILGLLLECLKNVTPKR